MRINEKLSILTIVDKNIKIKINGKKKNISIEDKILDLNKSKKINK